VRWPRSATAHRRMTSRPIRRGAFWRAGRGAADAQGVLGPLALTRSDDEGDLRVLRVAARDYRQLCRGQELDWVEAAGG